MTSFGSLIRSYRLRAGLGLRTFATLIDQRASIVSAVESNRRAPWRQAATLQRVADVLGLVESSNLWQKMVELAHSDLASSTRSSETSIGGRLAWWWPTQEAAELDDVTLAELATFIGATVNLRSDDNLVSDADPSTGSLPYGRPSQEATLNSSTTSSGHKTNSAEKTLPALTELAIEWRVRRLLGQRNTHLAAAPVDVEAVLENEAGVHLEIIPGLIPRFSVQACAIENANGMTFLIDRIVSDSRPMAAYRNLLAILFAPSALWHSNAPAALVTEPVAEPVTGADRSVAEAVRGWQAAEFRRWQACPSWAQRLRDCERFALAMLLPANPVLQGAESAYSELVQQQGWVDVDVAARTLRNRLAEQFAVSPTLVHRRLVGWPCHLYERIAQALAAQESTLPPLDWLVDSAAPRQRTLFDLGEPSDLGEPVR